MSLLHLVLTLHDAARLPDGTSLADVVFLLAVVGHGIRFAVEDLSRFRSWRQRRRPKRRPKRHP